jgi:hypothetical protein
MRRLIPLALVAPTLALGAVLAASPAQAACDSGPLRADLKAAKLVVTGKVTAIEERPHSQRYTLTVKRVYAGSATTTLEVQGPTAGAPCALPVAKGDDWLFLSDDAAQPPVVRRDGGSTKLSAEAATVVADVLGSGKQPVKGGAAPAEVTLEKVDAPKPYGFWQIALPGAVLAGGGFLVLLLARALGRART